MNSAIAESINIEPVRTGIVELPLNVDPESGLFGILTRPENQSRDTAFIFINAGLLHRVGPFRLYVDIARRIAEYGYSSIRLDQSGKGDSDAISSASLLDGNLSNIETAMSQLENETGAQRFVVCGLCSGADDILQAGGQLNGLAGIVMFDGYAPPTLGFYARRYGPKLFSLRSWIRRLRPTPQGDERATLGSMRNWGTPREMLARYRGLLDSGVGILAIFSGWPGNRYAYSSQVAAGVSHPKSGELLTEIHYREATHLFHSTEHRHKAAQAIVDWAATTESG